MKKKTQAIPVVMKMIGAMESIERYLKHKKPETVEEAIRMINLTIGICEETLEPAKRKLTKLKAEAMA